MPIEKYLIHFIDSWGQNKVLFGTDFPISGFERATREINELGFTETSKEKLLWKNAARLYGLGPRDGFDLGDQQGKQKGSSGSCYERNIK